MSKKDDNFWGTRSGKYNELEWVQHQEFLNLIVEEARLDRQNKVLDVGTGTGIVAQTIAPLVRSVMAVDSSDDMLKIAKERKIKNIDYLKIDAVNMELLFENTYDRVFCRYILHHLLGNNIIKCLKECYRILQEFGLLIVAEGVPPSDKTFKDFEEIFKLKEKRITFTTNMLVEKLNEADFINVTFKEMILKNMSIRNWLSKSGLEIEKQKVIFDIHKNHFKANDYFCKDYGMQKKDNDLLIDMKVCVVVGEKQGG